MDSLKKMVTISDKGISARFLALAFKLKFPDPVIKATQHNYYNFGSKREAVRAVKKQMGEMIESGQHEQRGIRAVMVEEREDPGTN